MSILAVDFGGTRIRAGRFTPDLDLEKRCETLSQVDQAPEVVLQRIIDTARNTLPRSSDPTTSISAIGISAPGPLDPQTGVIHHAKTLPGWHDVPLAEIISQAFGGVPAAMNNDANLAALAEYHLGAAKGADPMIYLTISTGIGGGAIINGHLFTGWKGLAIEPGHMRFTAPDGKVYRLEELASGTGIGSLARQKLASSGAASSLRSVEVVDGRAVGQAAGAGDTLALEVVQEAGTWLGLGLANLLHLFNPQAIVLGGSVTQLGDLILEPARSAMRQNLLDPGFDDPELVRLAHLGDDVCLFGAALYAQQSLKVGSSQS
jgi:glucokinase